MFNNNSSQFLNIWILWEYNVHPQNESYKSNILQSKMPTFIPNIFPQKIAKI